MYSGIHEFSAFYEIKNFGSLLVLHQNILFCTNWRVCGTRQGTMKIGSLWSCSLEKSWMFGCWCRRDSFSIPSYSAIHAIAGVGDEAPIAHIQHHRKWVVVCFVKLFPIGSAKHRMNSSFLSQASKKWPCVSATYPCQTVASSAKVQTFFLVLKLASGLKKYPKHTHNIRLILVF